MTYHNSSVTKNYPMEYTRIKRIVKHGAKYINRKDKKKRREGVPLSKSSAVSDIATLATIDEKFLFGGSEDRVNPSNPFITKTPIF